MKKMNMIKTDKKQMKQELNAKNFKNEILSAYLDVCAELSNKIPEKEAYFKQCMHEAVCCDSFPIADNLCDLIYNYINYIDKKIIIDIIRLYTANCAYTWGYYDDFFIVM